MSDVADDEHVKAAAKSIVERGWSEVVVVSLGAGGALVVTATDCHRIIAPIIPVRSRVGAGDSMVAGIVLAFVRDWPLAEAVRFGVAAGAAAVMQPGTDLCHGEDVERLFGRSHRHLS